ncbi:hypothetical protein Gpo141_00013284 [Globisporangium polare]
MDRTRPYESPEQRQQEQVDAVAERVRRSGLETPAAATRRGPFDAYQEAAGYEDYYYGDGEEEEEKAAPSDHYHGVTSRYGSRDGVTVSSLHLTQDDELRPRSRYAFQRLRWHSDEIVTRGAADGRAEVVSSAYNHDGATSCTSQYAPNHYASSVPDVQQSAPQYDIRGDAGQSTSNKTSMDFLMNQAMNTQQHRRSHEPTRPSQLLSRQEAESAAAAAVGGEAKSSSDERRRTRECKIDGCPNYIINRGLCFRHGGGRKCSEEGCNSSAKNAGKCWKHGGSVKCLVEDCTRKGKSRGVCWAHGGGTMCSSPSCEKVSVSNGFCWAHGGGKRCAFEGCSKAAYKRTHNYCVTHHALLKDGNVTMEI